MMALKMLSGIGSLLVSSVNSMADAMTLWALNGGTLPSRVVADNWRRKWNHSEKSA